MPISGRAAASPDDLPPHPPPNKRADKPARITADSRVTPTLKGTVGEEGCSAIANRLVRSGKQSADPLAFDQIRSPELARQVETTADLGLIFDQAAEADPRDARIVGGTEPPPAPARHRTAP